MGDFLKIRTNFPQTFYSTDRDIEETVKRILERAGKRVVGKLKLVTETWDNKPVFSVLVTRNGVVVKYDARTKGGKEFRWVDEGVKPHAIQPKADKAMTFHWEGRGSYAPKTRPGTLKSYKGRVPKGWISMKRVRHPGVYARRYAQVFMKHEQDSIMRELRVFARNLPRHAIYGPSMREF